MEGFVFLKPRKMKHPQNGMTLEYLEKQSAIAALLVSADGKKGYFVEQFRPGINGNSIEVIAGLIDEGEIDIDALYREVSEEGGYSKEDYDIIYTEKKPLAISPGYTEEKLSLYILKLKDGAEQKSLHLDEGEELEGKWLDFEEILEKSNDFKTFYLVKTYELLNLKSR